MICTTIEQSKKLIELKIDINTADMCWCNENDVITIPYIDSLITECPAWSLSALLDLIPPYLGEFNEGIDFGFDKAVNGKWYSAHYLQYTKEGINPIKTVTGDTAVDAVFEMIVWLKENKKM